MVLILLLKQRFWRLLSPLHTVPTILIVLKHTYKSVVSPLNQTVGGWDLSLGLRFSLIRAEGIRFRVCYSLDKLCFLWNDCFTVALCTTFAHINNGICSNASGKPWERIYPHFTHLISLFAFVVKQVCRRHRHDWIFTTSCLNFLCYHMEALYRGG